MINSGKKLSLRKSNLQNVVCGILGEEELNNYVENTISRIINISKNKDDSKKYVIEQRPLSMKPFFSDFIKNRILGICEKYSISQTEFFEYALVIGLLKFDEINDVNTFDLVQNPKTANLTVKFPNSVGSSLSCLYPMIDAVKFKRAISRTLVMSIIICWVVRNLKTCNRIIPLDKNAPAASKDVRIPSSAFYEDGIAATKSIFDYAATEGITVSKSLTGSIYYLMLENAITRLSGNIKPLVKFTETVTPAIAEPKEEPTLDEVFGEEQKQEPEITADAIRNEMKRMDDNCTYGLGLEKEKTWEEFIMEKMTEGYDPTIEEVSKEFIETHPEEAAMFITPDEGRVINALLKKAASGEVSLARLKEFAK